MSLVRPSFSHIFLNRRSICSAVSLPRSFTLIITIPYQPSFKPNTGGDLPLFLAQASHSVYPPPQNLQVNNAVMWGGAFPHLPSPATFPPMAHLDHSITSR